MRPGITGRPRGRSSCCGRRVQGAFVARQVLWGLLIGLFGFIGFFLVIGVTITTFGIAFAFIVAMFAVLTIQGCSLWLVNGRK